MLAHALNDPDFFLGDVDGAYRRLRAEAPVYRCERAGIWGLAKHADVDMVSRNPQLFCSSQGVIVNDPLDRKKGGAIRSADELGREWFESGGFGCVIRRPQAP